MRGMQGQCMQKCLGIVPIRGGPWIEALPSLSSELIARIQSSHEAILKEAGCLKENQTLTYGKVFPCSNTLEGLYIDDHLAFQVIDAKPTRDREPHGGWAFLVQKRKLLIRNTLSKLGVLGSTHRQAKSRPQLKSSGKSNS